jgi:hypothetical protein
MPGPVTLDEAVALLATRLRNMHPTRADGFEGLMRDLLEEFTQQSYRIAKSGPQGGSDMRSTSANTVGVALEAKRYGAKSRLPLDDLKYKVIDASRQDDPADLWILAATREISSTDARALAATGVAEGMAVSILDWPRAPGALPPLAVLCVAAPVALERQLGRDPDLAGAISLIGADSRFNSTREALHREYTSPDVGLAGAAAALNEWTRDAQMTEARARAELQGFNNLRGAGVKFAERPELNRQLGEWFAGGNRLGALIGEEGFGKTWAALGWWGDRDLRREQLPLTLFVPARAVSSLGLERLIAELLYQRTQVRDEDFWLKRLRLWRRARYERPLILLIVDGIDQLWTKRDWVDFFQPLYDEQKWGGICAALVTCRPDHWREMINLQGLTPPPLRIDVPRFSAAELDVLLTQNNLTRANFTTPVLELMAVPRLSLLALTQRAHLAASGDVTPERLVYEDWKHRLARRREPLNFEDAEFQALVADLGRNLRDTPTGFTVTRSDLLQRMSRDSGRPESDLREALSEVINGGWLLHGEHPHRFSVVPQRAPFALGLTLVAELHGVTDRGGADAVLAEFLDGLKGQSLGVSVLRAATTVALVDAETSKAVRRALIERWLSEQNFGRHDFDAMWRLIGADIELFCDLLEDFWLDQSSRSFQDEVLIKVAANSHQFLDVAPALQQRVAKWLGWIWLDPDQGRFIGRRDPESETALARSARTRSVLGEWSSNPSLTSYWPSIELREAGDVSWHCHRVLGIPSYTDRTPFIDAFLAWALGRSIMGMPRHFEELAWVIRLNFRDPVEFRSALLARIDALVGSGVVICQRAASWLLEALAAPEDEAKAAALRAAIETKTGMVEARAQELRAWSVRDICDPTHEIDPNDQRLEDIDGAVLWRLGRNSSDFDVQFPAKARALARSAPERLMTIVGQAVASAGDRSADELSGLLQHLPELLLVLSEGQRLAMGAVLDRHFAEMPAGAGLDQLRSYRLMLSVYGLPFHEQIPLLDAFISEGIILGDVIPLFAKPAPADYNTLEWRITPQRSPDEIKRWLGCLVRIVNPKFLTGWTNLADFIMSPNDDVRRLALQLTYASQNPSALAALAASPWSASTANKGEEIAYGSLSLVTAESVLGLPRMDARTAAEASALRLMRNPTDAEAHTAFSDYLKTEILALSGRGTISFPRTWDHHIEALRIFIDRDDGRFTAWFEEWLTEASLRSLGFYDYFPFLSLCQVLMERIPQVGTEFWRRLLNVMDEGPVGRDEILLLPIEAPDSSPVNAARRTVLDRCKTDEDLFDLARTAHVSCRTDWLMEEIRADCTSALPYQIGRGYMLLGLSDASAEANALWENLDKGGEGDGWLRSIFESAKALRDRNRHAMHWFREFTQSEDVAQVFGAFELFIVVADGRRINWGGDAFSGVGPELRNARLSHWRMNAHRLEKADKDFRDELRKTYLATRIIANTLGPWT